MSDPRQNPLIQEALARLEEAEVGLDQAILNAKQVELQTPKTQLSEEDIRLIEAHARGGEAPSELRELQRRIDAGELSWEDIAAGRHIGDPEVQAGLSTGVDGMRRAYAAIQEGQELDEIIGTGPPAPPRERPTDRDDSGRGYNFNRFDPDDE